MIYPASYDITLLQNATWSTSLRVTEDRQTLDSITVAAGVGTFTCDCHGLTAGDKVVFTGTALTGQELSVPCGLELNRVYYVISSGLTTGAFKVSATSGGSEVALSGSATGTFYVATPMNLTGYTIDADIYGLLTNTQEATMVCALSDAANGVVSLTVPPSTSASLEPGRYGYDVSFTATGGQRYYFLKGVATVERTYSRN
jgi:hypothetical protein